MSDRDPWCCSSDKLRANVDGFDQGALNAWRSARFAVSQLSGDEALAVIDSMITSLESEVTE